MPDLLTSSDALPIAGTPGLKGHYDASDQASINLADNAVVNPWYDISGNGKNLARNTFAGGECRWKAAILNGKGIVRITNGGWFTSAGFFTPAWPAWSYMAVMKVATGCSPINNGTPNWWLTGGIASPNGYKFNGNSQASVVNSALGGWHSLYWAGDISATTYGAPSMNYGLQLGPNRRNNGAQIASGTTLTVPNAGIMDIAEFALIDRKMTWTETIRIQRGLNEKWGLYDHIESSDTVVLHLGNSVSQIGWNTDLAGLVGKPCITLAIFGGTMATLAAQQAEFNELVRYLRLRGKKVVVTLWHGHNDLYGDGAVQIADIKSSIFQTIRRAGARLIGVTPSCIYGPANREPARVNMRAYMLTADALNYFDAINDIGGTPEFGNWGTAPGSSAGSSLSDPARTGSWREYGGDPDQPDPLLKKPILWSDNVHPTLVLGNAAVAANIEPTITAQIAQALGPPVPGTASLASKTATTANLNSTNYTGSVSGGTRQWQSWNGSAWVDISGATSSALNETGLTASQTYRRRVKYTDGSDQGGGIGISVYSAAIEYTTDAEVGDVDPPTVTGAVLGIDGTSLVVTFNENISPATGITGFTPIIGPDSLVIATANRTASNAVTLTLVGEVYTDEIVSLDYSTGNIVDLAGNALGAFTGLSVMNNSQIEEPIVPLSVSLTLITATSSTLSVAVTAAGGTPPYAYAWAIGGSPVSGSAASRVFTGLTPETASTIGVTVTDADSSTATDELTASTTAAQSPTPEIPADSTYPLATVYCTDEALAVRCPTDIEVLTPAASVLAVGSDGVFAEGTPWVLTSNSVNFEAQGIKAGALIHLSGGTIKGSGYYLVVSEVAGAALTLRRIGQIAGIGQPPGTAAEMTGVRFSITTLAPQIEQASDELNRQFGVDPRSASRNTSWIYDLRELQEATMLIVLLRQYTNSTRTGDGDFAFKVKELKENLSTTLARLSIRWGASGDDRPPTSMFGMKIARG